MDKEDVVYTHTHTHTNTGILFSPKKEWNNAICSNMDATRGYHTKWKKSERERQIPYDITYMWTLKYNTNEPIYETEVDSRHREQTCGCQRGEKVSEGWTWRLGLAD